MTPGKELEGRRVLIVEDRYVLASEIAELVRDMGAEVLGPAASVSAAEALVRELRANIALLDVNLGGEMIFPLAEQLAKQQTPVVLLTGYHDESLPAAWRSLPRLLKPVDRRSLREQLLQLA